jgi:hypothetical protein
MSEREPIPCRGCGIGLNLPVGREGRVDCPKCGKSFWTTTRDPPGFRRAVRVLLHNQEGLGKSALILFLTLVAWLALAYTSYGTKGAIFIFFGTSVATFLLLNWFVGAVEADHLLAKPLKETRRLFLIMVLVSGGFAVYQLHIYSLTDISDAEWSVTRIRAVQAELHHIKEKYLTPTHTGVLVLCLLLIAAVTSRWTRVHSAVGRFTGAFKKATSVVVQVIVVLTMFGIGGFALTGLVETLEVKLKVQRDELDRRYVEATADAVDAVISALADSAVTPDSQTSAAIPPLMARLDEVVANIERAAREEPPPGSGAVAQKIRAGRLLDTISEAREKAAVVRVGLRQASRTGASPDGLPADTSGKDLASAKEQLQASAIGSSSAERKPSGETKETLEEIMKAAGVGNGETLVHSVSESIGAGDVLSELLEQLVAEPIADAIRAAASEVLADLLEHPKMDLRGALAERARRLWASPTFAGAKVSLDQAGEIVKEKADELEGTLNGQGERAKAMLDEAAEEFTRHWAEKRDLLNDFPEVRDSIDQRLSEIAQRPDDDRLAFYSTASQSLSSASDPKSLLRELGMHERTHLDTDGIDPLVGCRCRNVRTGVVVRSWVARMSECRVGSPC